MLPKLAHVFIGTIIHSKSQTDLELLDYAMLGVLSSGKIAFLEYLEIGISVDGVLGKLKEGYDVEGTNVVQLTDRQFLIPGYLDTHIHSPQYVFSGTGYDLPLLGWLEKYTFPRESEFSDLSYAKDSYTKVVSRTLRSGTTTACYYATIHLGACKVLAEVVLDVGQRAFLGKVNMDRNSPETYIEDTEASIEDTKVFVNHVINRDTEFRTQFSDPSTTIPLITPCITPRFVPSCTSKLMSELSKIAAEYNLPIQSHLSESKNEIEWVKELHPHDGDTPCFSDTEGTEWSYTGVYHSHGLLTNRSIMAHCIHLSKSERRLIKNLEAGISHCPASNFQLSSGVLNVRRLLNEGIKVGLGTDMAGGHAPSIIEAMRLAMVASKTAAMMSRDGLGGWGEELENEVKDPLTLAEVFYLATLGGAKVMGLDGSVGNFEVGKEFDALVVDLSSTGAAVGDAKHATEVHGTFTVDVFPHDDKMSMFEKYIYLGDDRNIAEVYVAGRKVVPTPLAV
ncbi:hypothetical protein HK098_008160 [Nowakowskiella sp. JEL0407]|nr:hypothetical protein HK098_008160 [Nowakowskiella sp. JEL0407]